MQPTAQSDYYGRFVGGLQVWRRGSALRRLAATARRKRLGVWAWYTTDADRFDPRLVFRSHGPIRADRGLVSLPKMFRRASVWQLSKPKESFAEYLHCSSDWCYLTRDFLREAGERMRLNTLLSDHGRVRVGPAEVVFCER